MVQNIRKYWEADIVDVASTTVANKITELRGGESITIKSLAGSSHSHYIGPDSLVRSSRGYKLDTGETMSISIPIEFGATNFIEIWAIATNAGDDVCYIKVINEKPETEAST